MKLVAFFTHRKEGPRNEKTLNHWWEKAKKDDSRRLYQSKKRLAYRKEISNSIRTFEIVEVFRLMHFC